MLPFANTAAMQMHLDEISCNVAAKAHGVVLMDRAGWHSTDQLKVPKNLTIILLPSRSPELNPVENIWQGIVKLTDCRLFSVFLNEAKPL